MNGKLETIEQHISKTIDKHISFHKSSAVSGGCISQSFKVTDTNKNQWFIKTNSPSSFAMFEAESEGLAEIQKSTSIRTPKVICHGKNNQISYLVLEYIELRPQLNQIETGKQLAAMHQHHSDQFGWKRNNTIGSTPQLNQKNTDWLSFWKTQRLLFQLDLAKTIGYSNKAYDCGLELINHLAEFFVGYTPQASLLHGDLWGGNCASDETGNPVIFDPAVYFGDRETDLAMTELFGGFSAEFYASYNDHYPLDFGYKTRKQLYNLYHILNHFNLFGGGYASQAENMTLQLLAEI